ISDGQQLIPRIFIVIMRFVRFHMTHMSTWDKISAADYYYY
ncbi:unnamed protein product, partial [Adineta ricciae]